MNYGREDLKNESKSVSSAAVRKKNHRRIASYKILLFSLLAVVCIIAATGIGMITGIINAAPDLDDLDMSPDATATTIYDSDGNVIETLVMEGSNRELVEYEDLPEDLINAFVAIEDSRFWTHSGVDIKGIVRAFVSGITSGDFDQGASTITQQLIKNVAFDGGAESTFIERLVRKIQEQYLALELEKVMDKEIILLNYLNTINLGSNTLGVESASQRYFGKSVSELNLSECAVLAAITQNPTAYNPITYPEANKERRDTVLEYMYEQGYITEEEMLEAMTDDVYDLIAEVNETYTAESSVYSYFVDEVIVNVLADLVDIGYTESEARTLLYSGGLKIYTTMDSDLQAIVDEEISDPDNYTDTQYSFTWTLILVHEDDTTTTYSETDIKSWLREKNGAATTLIFDTEEEIDSVIEEFKAEVMLETDWISYEGIDVTLQPQASVVLMEQETGYVLAISGGRGEKTTSLSLNRATDSLRQPGSTFKIITAFAPALDTGIATLGTVYYDSSYTIGEKTFSNWWGSSYVGYANIRSGITYSMNIIALKTLNITVTPEVGFQYALDFGFTSLVESEVDEDTGEVYSDIGSSLCLGGLTYGVSNLELTAAYAAIANEGVYNEPIYYTKVVDSSGRILIDKEETQESHTVIKETTAWLLTDAMQGVTTLSYLYDRSDIRSSAPQAGLEDMPTAGKSGTTSNSYDVWFIGYTPYYTLGCWQGYDENSSMSSTEDVKTMFYNIMSRVCEGLEYKDFPDMPSNITSATICAKSGKLAIEGVCDCDPEGDMTYTEYFVNGTAPTEVCDHHTTVTICTDSGLLATEDCPESSKETVVYRVVTDDDDCETDDTEYTIPDSLVDSYCTVHGSSSSEDTDSDDDAESDDTADDDTADDSADDDDG